MRLANMCTLHPIPSTLRPAEGAEPPTACHAHSAATAYQAYQAYPCNFTMMQAAARQATTDTAAHTRRKGQAQARQQACPPSSPSLLQAQVALGAREETSRASSAALSSLPPWMNSRLSPSPAGQPAGRQANKRARVGGACWKGGHAYVKEEVWAVVVCVCVVVVVGGGISSTGEIASRGLDGNARWPLLHSVRCLAGCSLIGPGHRQATWPALSQSLEFHSRSAVKTPVASGTFT